MFDHISGICDDAKHRIWFYVCRAEPVCMCVCACRCGENVFSGVMWETDGRSHLKAALIGSAASPPNLEPSLTFHTALNST